MAEKKIFSSISLLILLFLFFGCSNPESSEHKGVFKQMPEIAEIKPQRPVKIKLKRNYDGNYSWELTGDNANEVARANRELKESIGTK